MVRTVRKDLIDRWIEEKSPLGQEQLSVESGVSYFTVGAIRRGEVPTGRTRRKLAKALGFTEDEVFPVVGSGQEKAS